MSSPQDYYTNPQWEVDSWVDIISVEYESLIRSYPFDEVFRRLGPAIRLLDVGCGTAIFPGYLDATLSDEIRIKADLLDISHASLISAATVLADLTHFTVGETYRSLIEDLPRFADGTYDVAWAIHSFTTVALERMPEVYDRLVGALRRGGYLYVYQLTGHSAYQQVHEHYLSGHTGKRFMEFEDSVEILTSLGLDYDVYELAFDHIVPDTSEALTQYLRKVTLDETVSVDFFEPILGSFRDGDVLRFPQTVNLIAVRRR